MLTPGSRAAKVLARAISYMGVVLREHYICGEPCIQRNASREVATLLTLAAWI